MRQRNEFYTSLINFARLFLKKYGGGARGAPKKARRLEKPGFFYIYFHAV